jgi:single-strand DNA-binding protein
MPNLNRVILIGYLGADPETKPAGETTVTKFNLAVTDRWTDKAGEKQEHTNWIPVTVWNGRGEQVTPYIKKGSCVLVEGSLRTSEWDDKQSGQKRWGFEVVASSIIFLDKKAQAELPTGRRKKAS